MEFCGTSYSLWWTYTSCVVCVPHVLNYYIVPTVMNALQYSKNNIRPHETETHAIWYVNDHFTGKLDVPR